MSELHRFPPELFALFETLERDNSTSFWNRLGEQACTALRSAPRA
jgi:hypothetical protein